MVSQMSHWHFVLLVNSLLHQLLINPNLPGNYWVWGQYDSTRCTISSMFGHDWLFVFQFYFRSFPNDTILSCALVTVDEYFLIFGAVFLHQKNRRNTHRNVDDSKYVHFQSDH